MVHSVQGSHSRGQHLFSMIPEAHIQRSAFNRSHGLKTTFNEGYLIPILVDEVLPGDTHSCSMTALCRMSTPIFPVMDNLFFETHFWFVPCRLVWEHWEEFNGQQLNTNSSTSYIVPVVTSAGTGFVSGSLADYFGIPILTPNALSVNAMPFRAYNLIYNEWYRDENLQNSLVVDIDDGPDTLANYAVVRRGKRPDYFTTALPWPQKINDGTTIDIPLGTSAPVVRDPNQTTIWLNNGTDNFLSVTNAAAGTYNFNAAATVSANLAHGQIVDGTLTGLMADLTGATAASINELRLAFQMQVLFERDARGGTRYTEIIRAHFNVISPDARLQRPEYLGGGSQMINITPVPQTSGTGIGGEDSAQGNLSGFGVGHVSGHGFTKSFTEHGYIIGIASVRADLNYQQGTNRLWTRSSRYSFYWPALAHIGEQAISLGELYTVGGTVTTNGWSTADAVVFGYQERYAEYRYKPSLITGLFRSAAAGTLDSWHLAQILSTPALNATFIVENAPMARVLATEGAYGADFICDVFFSYKSARPMPLYGDPMQLGRF